MTSQPVEILLVEDNEDDAYLIREMLIEKEEAGILLVWVDVQYGRANRPSSPVMHRRRETLANILAVDDDEKLAARHVRGRSIMCSQQAAANLNHRVLSTL